jgi:hypothetical protein
MTAVTTVVTPGVQPFDRQMTFKIKNKDFRINNKIYVPIMG